MAKSKLDTSYDKNLTLEQQKTPTVRQNAIAQPIDTSYQNNAGTLYGGHDAGWWQQQYSSQSSDETRNMVRKAADYYGYKIDENTKLNNTNTVGTYGNYMNVAANSQGAIPTVQSYSANSPQVAAYTSQSQTQDGTTTPVGTDSAPVDSYEEFLRKRGETYKENLDRQKQMIEDRKQKALEQAELQRQQTEQNAEQERERSVIDARSSYEQNKATYGAQAETLANMGLTGSGYSDYINAQAYANQRAETQNANANAEQTKNNAKYVADNAKLEIEQNAGQNKLSAETSYAENMANNDAAIAQYRQQKEEEKKNAYSELLNYANNGTYDSEQLKNLGGKYGLSEEDITSLKDAALKYETNRQNENYNKLLGEADVSGFESIKSALNKGDITQEQYNNLVTEYQKYYYDSYSSSVESDFSAVSTSEIDKAYNRGYISQEQYNNLKTQYNNGVLNAITAATIFVSNGVDIGEDKAKAVVDELKKSGWLTDEVKSQLDSKLSSAFAKDDDGGGCYASGTLITMADGSLKVVENVIEGDNVLTFNHFTGEVNTAPVSLVFSDEEKSNDIIYLNFEDKLGIEVVYGHGFYDIDLKKYVVININNVHDFIGHKFACLYGDNNQLTLTDCKLYKKNTKAYSILTAGNFNCFAGGLLSITDDGNKPAGILKGFYNLFECDENYIYSPDEISRDINVYGLAQYEDWKDIVTEEQFIMFNGKYLNIAIGKGLVTKDEVVVYINKFLTNKK